MTLKRREFLRVAGGLPLTGFASPVSSRAADLNSAKPSDKLRPFTIEVPKQLRTLPEGSDRSGSRPGFTIRGIKGWSWLPEQYLEEIPVLARYRLNFLMNCYSSLWELGADGEWGSDRPINFWYRPLPETKRAAFTEVIRSSQEHGLHFCFSVNPNLRSDKPFDYESASDLNALWQHYAWAQKLGVKWFNVSFDDISRRIDADGQARLLNEILQRLRARDEKAQLTFCPTWYAGTGEAITETANMLGSGDTPGIRYTKTLANELSREIYLFWTGPQVCSLAITVEQAKKYKALAGHRILIWDNYPVNDGHPTMNLGPLTGRDPGLCQVADGYLSNSMARENKAGRIPLLTIADYLWNPREYRAARSISQATAHMGETPAQLAVLRSLVELYPGRLWDGSFQTSWNSTIERWQSAIKRGDRDEARSLFNKAQVSANQMKAAFSDTERWGLRVLVRDIDAMREGLAQR
jgi:hypothetical protein